MTYYITDRHGTELARFDDASPGPEREPFYSGLAAMKLERGRRLYRADGADGTLLATAVAADLPQRIDVFESGRGRVA